MQICACNSPLFLSIIFFTILWAHSQRSNDLLNDNAPNIRYGSCVSALIQRCTFDKILSIDLGNPWSSLFSFHHKTGHFSTSKDEIIRDIGRVNCPNEWQPDVINLAYHNLQYLHVSLFKYFTAYLKNYYLLFLSVNLNWLIKLQITPIFIFLNKVVKFCRLPSAYTCLMVTFTSDKAHSGGLNQTHSMPTVQLSNNQFRQVRICIHMN